jgi:hypothetical protein
MAAHNWQNELTKYGIEDVERKLQDAKERIGNNQELMKLYQEALDSVSQAREAINRFVGTYNITQVSSK